VATSEGNQASRSTAADQGSRASLPLAGNSSSGHGACRAAPSIDPSASSTQYRGRAGSHL